MAWVGLGPLGLAWVGLAWLVQYKIKIKVKDLNPGPEILNLSLNHSRTSAVFVSFSAKVSADIFAKVST